MKQDLDVVLVLHNRDSFARKGAPTSKGEEVQLDTGVESNVCAYEGDFVCLYLEDGRREEARTFINKMRALMPADGLVIGSKWKASLKQ